jgi:hypothetical protein
MSFVRRALVGFHDLPHEIVAHNIGMAKTDMADPRDRR